jgi:hypothetical protein
MGNGSLSWAAVEFPSRAFFLMRWLFFQEITGVFGAVLFLHQASGAFYGLYLTEIVL